MCYDLFTPSVSDNVDGTRTHFKALTSTLTLGVNTSLLENSIYRPQWSMVNIKETFRLVWPIPSCLYRHGFINMIVQFVGYSGVFHKANINLPVPFEMHWTNKYYNLEM